MVVRETILRRCRFASDVLSHALPCIFNLKPRFRFLAGRPTETSALYHVSDKVRNRAALAAIF
jgi:hypothetical protein